MTGYIGVAGVRDLNEGELRRVTAGTTELLLAKTGGRVYALERYCPHLGADLSEGTLSGTVLTCPFHHSQFDVRDGRVMRWTDLTGTILEYATRAQPPRPLKTYPVKIEGDRILIGLPGD